MKTILFNFRTGVGTLGLCVLGLTACDNKNQALFQQVNQAKEQIEELETKLKSQEDLNKKVEERLIALAESKPTPSAASTPTPTESANPLVLSEATLKESLKKVATDRVDELQKLLAADGIELSGTSIPVVVVPKPYVAEVILNLKKDERALPSIPLTVYADWNGKWEVPEGPALVKTIKQSLAQKLEQSQNAVSGAKTSGNNGAVQGQNPARSAINDMTKSLGATSNNSKTVDLRTRTDSTQPANNQAANPNDVPAGAPSAEPAPEPAPIKRSIPLPAGVTDVREIDLRKK